MVITQTPLRISFAGGGSDFREYFERHGGKVVSTSIDKYIYVVAQRRIDNFIILHYSKREEVQRIEDVQHDLIRACLRRMGITSGIEIHLLADIHLVGSGLGASSSLTVGVLHALYALQGQQPSAKKLAELACQVEIEDCGRPIGVQDQYIAAYGGLRRLSFDAKGVTTQELAISDARRNQLGNSLLLFSLGYGADNQLLLQEQRQRTQQGDLDDTLKTLKVYAERVQCLLTDGAWPLDCFGEILHDTWIFKKTFASGITNPRIEDIYAIARSKGARGGKICGAGGRGHILFYVPPRWHPDVIGSLTQIEGVTHLPFHFEPHGSRVLFKQT